MFSVCFHYFYEVPVHLYQYISSTIVLCVAVSKPTFTSPLKDQKVPEEESVTLECELSKPDQKVTWLKDGKEIKPDRKRGIIPKVEGTKHILTIPKALKDDTAEYSVKCGDEVTKGKLTVEGMPGSFPVAFCTADPCCLFLVSRFLYSLFLLIHLFLCVSLFSLHFL